MTTARLWIIAGGAAAAVALLVVILVFALPRPTASPAATPTTTPTGAASPTPAPAQTSTASPTPTPTSAPTPAAATCENTSTDEFQALARANGWVSWSTVGERVGARPFDDFPGGVPDGHIVCRWGVGPEVATDNIIDLAWARIDAYDAVTAMQQLEQAGWTRGETDASGATLLTGESGPGGAFLFTPFDVRWAAYADHLEYIASPDDPR